MRYLVNFISLLLVLSQFTLGQTSTRTISDDAIYIHGELDNDSGIIDAPVKVEALSGEEINEQHHSDLSKAITDIPGVTNSTIHSRVGGKSAMIQGFGENSVLVMIDGTPVAQNSSFGFDLTQISTDDIEQIEVVKGGASALYGSQAIGGVINIRTKRPTKKTKYQIDYNNTVSSDHEGFESSNLKAHVTGTTFGIGNKFSVSRRKQDSFDLDQNTISQDGTAFEKYNASAYFEKKWKDSHLFFFNYSLFSGESEGVGSAPAGTSGFQEIVNKTNTNTQTVKLGNIYKVGDAKISPTVSYELTKDEISLNDNPKTSYIESLKKTKYQSTRAEVTYEDLYFDNHSATFGLLYKEQFLDQSTRTQQVESFFVDHNDVAGKRVWSAEGFIQDNIMYDQFEVSPGVRAQYDAGFGNQISPKINISYYNKITEHLDAKTWVSVGTGYRTPTIKERFFSLDHTSIANYIVKGNDNLLPEESVSMQLGQELTYNKGHKVYGNLFYNRINNLINTYEIEDKSNITTFTYKNYSEVFSRGFELGTSFKFENDFTFKYNFTYSKVTDEESGLSLTNRPLYVTSFSTKYTPSDDWMILNTVNYKGNEFVKEDNTEISRGYTTVDMKVNYKFSKQIDTYLGINNLFNITKDASQDSVVSVIDNRPSLGRLVFLGLTIKDL